MSYGIVFLCISWKDLYFTFCMFICVYVFLGVSASSPVALSPTSSPPDSEIVPIPSIDDVTVTVGERGDILSVADLGYYPSDLVCQGVELLHQTSGLPYWATIVGITFALRTMLLPVAFQAMRNSAKLANMKPEMDIMQERMKVRKCVVKNCELY